MNENEPANMSMPPQPAWKEGGLKLTTGELDILFLTRNEPPVITPRVAVSYAPGSVLFDIDSNMESSCD
ncbi:hypothetical protein D3C84_979630 [compost metagenome]